MLSSTGAQFVYVDDPNMGIIAPAFSPFANFPAGSLPIAVLVLDGVGRIQQITDSRPSYLSSAPDLGSGMTESIADATRRVYFRNNYAVPRTYGLSAQIPPDLSLPASGFVLGSGSVVLSGNVITTPTTYISAEAKVLYATPVTRFVGALAQSGTTQGYIDPSDGSLTTPQTQTSGVFPNGCLPIFEATTNCGLIRNLVDWRPSYI